MRGGVHELIPVLILAAVGVAAVFAVLSLVQTTWGNMGFSSAEIVRIGADTKVTWCSLPNETSVAVVALQYFNEGLHDVLVYKVEIVGFGCYDVEKVLENARFRGDTCIADGVMVVPGGVVLPHGSRGYVFIVIPDEIASRLPGQVVVKVKLYTGQGNIFLSAPVVLR